MQIFKNETSNTTSGVVDLRGGNSWVLSVGGTFGGGTFKLIYVDDDGNDIDIPNTSVTAATVLKLELPSGTRVKGNLSGSSSASLDAFIRRL